MATANSATARLRRTFHYPTDDDSADSQVEALDEQEQEDLIALLAAENAARDAQFRRILLAVPLAAALPYLPSLFRPRTALLALLSLTSLASTAYLLYRQRPAESGIAWLDACARAKTPEVASRASSVAIDEDDEDGGLAGSSSSSREYTLPRARHRRERRSSFSYVERKSPLEVYLPYLNLGLGAVLVLMTWAVDRSGKAAVWTGMGYLPLVVYAVVLASKMVMSGVDPEKELSALKYDYKGA